MRIQDCHMDTLPSYLTNYDKACDYLQDPKMRAVCA